MPSIQRLEHLARLQESRRLPGHAHARRRTGEDHVAGQERQHRRELGDEPRHAEDEVARARVLHGLAVDRAAEGEVVGIRHLVGRDEPRPIGP